MQWLEGPLPLPSSGEVLIKVKAAGINRPDIMQRQGNYPPPLGASDILGLEVSGEIVALGKSVKRWKTGDRVCALLSGGGYAEYALAPEGQCLPVPFGLSFVEAAALPECVFTIWANLFEAGALQANDIVLLHGGGSGIGTTAIQMTKAQGARIFVTVGSDKKADACRKIGADLTINYKRDDFVEVIERETAKHGVNIVIDMIGGDYIERNLSLLAPQGRHVSIAVQHGLKASIDLWAIMRKRLILTGSTLRPRSLEEKDRLRAALEAKIWPWIAGGKIKPLIYKTFSIKQVVEAHKMMESGVHIGKIVLEVGAESA